MQEYAQRRRHSPVKPAQAQTADTLSAGPSISALKAGAAAPSGEQLGRPVQLEAAIRAKMEHAFGADLSAVKLYESQTVADAGAAAVAQGNRIAFAPGKTDFHSRSGQELLGHELSHVMSQTRGGVRGYGLLRDSGLEARADREGVLAAAGQSVSEGGPVLGTLSAASPAAAVSGPMQAKEDKSARKQASKMAKLAEKSRNNNLSGKERRQYDALVSQSMSNPAMMQAIYQKQTEKRQKEMGRYRSAEGKRRSADRKKYSSQDRYQYLLEDIRQRADNGSEEEQAAYRNAQNIALKGYRPGAGEDPKRFVPGLEHSADFLAVNQRWEEGGWRKKPEDMMKNWIVVDKRARQRAEAPQNAPPQQAQDYIDLAQLPNDEAEPELDAGRMALRPEAEEPAPDNADVVRNAPAEENKPSMKQIMNMKDLMNRQQAPRRPAQEDQALQEQLKADNAKQKLEELDDDGDPIHPEDQEQAEEDLYNFVNAQPGGRDPRENEAFYKKRIKELKELRRARANQKAPEEKKAPEAPRIVPQEPRQQIANPQGGNKLPEEYQKIADEIAETPNPEEEAMEAEEKKAQEKKKARKKKPKASQAAAQDDDFYEWVKDEKGNYRFDEKGNLQIAGIRTPNPGRIGEKSPGPLEKALPAPPKKEASAPKAEPSGFDEAFPDMSGFPAFQVQNQQTPAGQKAPEPPKKQLSAFDEAFPDVSLLPFLNAEPLPRRRRQNPEIEEQKAPEPEKKEGANAAPAGLERPTPIGRSLRDDLRKLEENQIGFLGGDGPVGKPRLFQDAMNQKRAPAEHHPILDQSGKGAPLPALLDNRNRTDAPPAMKGRRPRGAVYDWDAAEKAPAVTVTPEPAAPEENSGAALPAIVDNRNRIAAPTAIKSSRPDGETHAWDGKGDQDLYSAPLPGKLRKKKK